MGGDQADSAAQKRVEGDKIGRSGQSRRRVMPRMSAPAWLLRAIVESSFIVLSILLALAVDQWRDNRNHDKLAGQSLQIFAREIKQNLARLDDVVPYHLGLQDVVGQMIFDPSRAADVQSILEGLKGTVLLNTAWETALATGALTYIDVETVSALSLTYSLQEQFQQENRASLARLGLGASNTTEQALARMRETLGYLTGLVKSEEELRSVFKQALESIAPSTTPADKSAEAKGVSNSL